MGVNLLIKNITAILFVIVFFGCNQEENPSNPPEGILFFSTTFENNGQPSSDGWTIPSQSKFAIDSPSGGGTYSLSLEANWGSELYAERKSAVMTQYKKYNLTFWSKYSTVKGKAILSLIRDGSVIAERSIQVDEIVWRSYSITDTFSVAAGDSFLVRITGGITQLLPAETNFDLCKLEAFEE